MKYGGLNLGKSMGKSWENHGKIHGKINYQRRFSWEDPWEIYRKTMGNPIVSSWRFRTKIIRKCWIANCHVSLLESVWILTLKDGDATEK